MSDNLPVPGRVYDILVFRGPAPDGSGRQALAVLPDGPAASATGVVKLVQRALLEFLTRKGSMPFLPDRGSSFMTVVAQGLLRTDTDVYQQFAFAAADVKRNLVADQTDGDPADERLAVFELTGVAISAGQLVLRINIESAAGTGIVVPLPIPTSP